MEQFSLDKWLENPSRKVVTRDGRPARIICTDAKGELPIVALVPFGNNEDAYHYNVNGVANGFQSLTLFFADEEEELTEFEKRIYSLINFSDPDNFPSIEEVKEESEILLDLARKELKKIEQDSAWSEEDEKIYQSILDDTVQKYLLDDNQFAWLKSLKTKSYWKPSKGQLDCLGYAVEKFKEDYSPLSTNRIYLTLKALKEQLEKL